MSNELIFIIYFLCFMLKFINVKFYFIIPVEDGILLKQIIYYIIKFPKIFLKFNSKFKKKCCVSENPTVIIIDIIRSLDFFQ